MRRKLTLSIALALTASLLAAPFASAAQIRIKRHVPYHWKGYGFLPGYRTPERIEWERARHAGLWSGRPVYWYGRAYYGYGGPGFYEGRWNGGSFGPCYTRTPIGPIWNCGR